MLKLIKKLTAKRKEMITFTSLMLIAISFTIAAYLRFPIPSPTEIIETLLDPVVKPIQLWTKGES